MYRGSHESGPTLLAIMGIASFFVCIVLMENAVLQASGREKFTMYTMIGGGLVKIIINYFLIGNPDINICGAPIGTLVSYLFMAIANYVVMCFALDKNPKVLNIVKAPLAASAAMGVAAFGVYELMHAILKNSDWLHTLIAMGVAMIVAIVVYAFAAIRLKAITAEDLGLIPGGAKVAKLLHMN